VVLRVSVIATVIVIVIVIVTETVVGKEEEGVGAVPL
jgi:hypothetical protein